MEEITFFKNPQWDTTAHPLGWLLSKSSWWGCGEKGTLVHCWWECKMVQLLWRTVWRFFRKLKIELPCDAAVPLLGIYLKGLKGGTWMDICTSLLIVALFIRVKRWKQTKHPLMDEWINKCGLFRQWNFIHPQKGRESWHILQHE